MNKMNEKIKLAMQLVSENPDMDIEKTIQLIGVKEEEHIQPDEPAESERSVKSRWTETEDDKLIDMRNRGFSYRDISRELSKTEPSITSRVTYLIKNKTIKSHETRRRHKYTKEQDAILKSLLVEHGEPKKVPVSERETMASLVGVTHQAIYTRLYLLKKRGN